MKIKSFISKPSFWIPFFILVVFLMFFVSSARKENFKNNGNIGGSWSQSCDSINQKKGWLQANCKQRDGRRQLSSLDTTTCPNGWKAKNDDGKLKCD